MNINHKATAKKIMTFVFSAVISLILISGCSATDPNMYKRSSDSSDARAIYNASSAATTTAADSKNTTDTANNSSEPATNPGGDDTNYADKTRVSLASILSVGDLLMHDPIIKSAYSSSTKSYSFDKIFEYVAPYIKEADYAVANLEVTLGGEEAGEYRGYPMFNCPDQIVDAVKNAGFDMLLTANNHTYDTGKKGLFRTQNVIRDRGMDYNGTRLSQDEKRYIVKDINGIKIGMINYTYETSDGSGSKSLNGIKMASAAAPLVNSFSERKLDEFYSEVNEAFSGMKSDGAEAIMIYIHWGQEYNLKPNDLQKSIAQKMCDLGADALIGGHPHVIQPVETYESDISGKKMLCAYSMGNAVSNQRAKRMNLNTGHTEDGGLFKTVFAKYSDGSVRLESVEIIPTWVNLVENGGARSYYITPLDKDTSFDGVGLSDSAMKRAKESYQRTMDLVEEGVNEFNGNSFAAAA